MLDTGYWMLDTGSLKFEVTGSECLELKSEAQSGKKQNAMRHALCDLHPGF